MSWKRNKQSQRKAEFSKIACSLASSVFVGVGVWMIYRYYALVELAIKTEASIAPDSALPIAGITAIFTPIIAYLIYQFKLKNSRNKYGISENGVPYAMPDQNGGE